MIETMRDFGGEIRPIQAPTKRDEPNRIPAVQAAIAQQDAELDQLDKLVRALSERLEPVLTPEADGEDEEGCAYPVRCELSGKIDSQVGRVRKINERLNSLLSRLEL